jgi:hypothetical protein
VGFVVDKAELTPASHHSTNFSIIMITLSWHDRPISGRSAEWTQLDSTPHTIKTIISVFVSVFISASLIL